MTLQQLTIEVLFMQCLSKKTNFSCIYMAIIFLICFLIPGCFVRSFSYKNGKSFYNRNSNIRFLQSNDGITTEIDGFGMRKDTIKQTIWEDTYFLYENSYYPTQEMRLFKKNIITHHNETDTSYDENKYDNDYPMEYMHIRLLEVDFLDGDPTRLDLRCPESIIINIHFESESFDHTSFFETFSLARFRMHIIVTDRNAKTIFDDNFLEKHSDWESQNNIALTINIYPSTNYDPFSNNNNHLKYWNSNHYSFTLPSDDLCQRFSSGIYFHESNYTVV